MTLGSPVRHHRAHFALVSADSHAVVRRVPKRSTATLKAWTSAEHCALLAAISAVEVFSHAA